MLQAEPSPVLVVDNTPWTLVQCGPASEFKVRDALTEYGLTAYVTVERVWRGLGGRRRPHERPLIRGYVFAQLGDRAHLLHAIGKGCHVVAGSARAIGAFVGALQEREANGDYDHAQARKALKVGDSVRLIHGPFAGVTGSIGKLDTDRRATVMLNAVRGLSGKMTVNVAHLEEAPAVAA